LDFAPFVWLYEIFKGKLPKCKNPSTFVEGPSCPGLDLQIIEFHSFRRLRAVCEPICRSSYELFFSTAEVLEVYPYRGRVVPEIGLSTIRQLLCSHYRIIYEVLKENKIGIPTVHHQSRLLKNNPAMKRRLRKKGK
jgi:plasmid stabilization system protein ParE